MAGRTLAHDTQNLELVAVKQEQGVVWLTLNNPPANALSVSVIGSLQAVINRAADDATVRVLVIGAAGKLFSAGHDLKELTSHRSDPDRGKAFFESTFGLCSNLMQSIVGCPKPVIAAVDGIATAAGCQLIASCDLAVASDRSKFGVNGIDVGLFCTSPAVALTRVVNRKRAMEMLLTGVMVDAQRAEEFGLVNRVVPAAILQEAVTDLAAVLASKSPAALKIGKRAVNRHAGMSLSDAYTDACAVMVENLMIEDAEEGIDAFIARRTPKWAGPS